MKIITRETICIYDKYVQVKFYYPKKQKIDFFGTNDIINIKENRKIVMRLIEREKYMNKLSLVMRNTDIKVIAGNRK